MTGSVSPAARTGLPALAAVSAQPNAVFPASGLLGETWLVAEPDGGVARGADDGGVRCVAAPPDSTRRHES